MLDVNIRTDLLNQLLGGAVERVAENRIGLLARDGAADEDDAAHVIVERADDCEAMTDRDRRDSIFRRAENEFLAGAFDGEEGQHRPPDADDHRQQRESEQEGASHRSFIHRVFSRRLGTLFTTQLSDSAITRLLHAP